MRRSPFVRDSYTPKVKDNNKILPARTHEPNSVNSIVSNVDPERFFVFVPGISSSRDVQKRTKK